MTENYLIIDECGNYVVGYVMDRQEVRYIAYSNKDSCSVGLLNYNSALNQKEFLENLQKKLLKQNKIDNVHNFYIVNV